MKRLYGILFLIVCCSCNDGSGPFYDEEPKESFSLQVSASGPVKTYTDALLTDADVSRHALKNYNLKPNYTSLNNFADALVSFYSQSLPKGTDGNSAFGFRLSYPQPGSYSLTELYISATDSIFLHIDTLLLIPLGGSLKILSQTGSDPSRQGSTGLVKGTIGGSFYNAADSTEVYTVNGSFYLN
jgi:hypothetical protein